MNKNEPSTSETVTVHDVFGRPIELKSVRQTVRDPDQAGRMARTNPKNRAKRMRQDRMKALKELNAQPSATDAMQHRVPGSFESGKHR